MLKKDKFYFKAMIRDESIHFALEYNLDEEYAMNCIANLISHEEYGDYRNVEYLSKLFRRAEGYEAIAINCELRYIRHKLMQEIHTT